MQVFYAIMLAMHGETLKETPCIIYIHFPVKSQPSNDVDPRIIPECLYWRKSPVYGSLLVSTVAVLLSAPAWLSKPALGNVVLYDGVHGVVFGNAVADALQDDLDPTIKGGQMGVPQHRGHRVLAHGLPHRGTQLARSVVEPVDSNSQG
jgi:hypothetical protein